MVENLKSSRFQLLRKLGSGGMGVVYEAYDHQMDSIVALKTIPNADGEALYRLKKEFRALSDVQHPNLVRFGELLCEGGQWFFTMEVVSGRDFYAWVRTGGGDDPSDVSEQPTEAVAVPPPLGGGDLPAPAPASREPRGFDEARLRAAARQLAAAIAALHRSGRVHRDLKPSNVLVRDDGHLVLLDFGLIEEVAARSTARSRRELIMGTPGFMAPEQADAEHVGPEADWYAFGVMLYLALTGRLPFRGSPEQMLESKRRLAPRPPRELVVDVPEDLDQLCCDLLDREPHRRPDGASVLSRLGGDVAVAASSRGSPSLDSAALFVGRAAELAALSDAFGRCRAGGSAYVVVRGEAGVGKSALVRHFLERIAAEEPRAVMLAGRCYEQESVPFKAFDTIIDSLSLHLSALPPEELRPLVRSGVRFLASVFPVLKRVPSIGRGISSDRTVPNPTALRAQAFQELRQLLSQIAEQVPLVLFIDDLQWADRDSVALLQALLLSSGSPRCLFVATARADAARRPGAEPALAGLDELLAASRVVDLGGLSREESRSLCAALTGADGGGAGAPTLDPLLDEAAGHPLFLAELVRHVGTAPHQQPGVLHLKDVLWSRYLELDEPARRFLELVALAGAPIQLPVITQAAELDPDASLHLLADLRAGQLIRVSRVGARRLVEPYHDRIREAIIERLRPDEHAPPPAIRALHLRLGRALFASTPEDELPAAIFTIVQHLNLGAPLVDAPDERRRLAELNLLAGRQARLATAYEAALAHLERGIALLGEEPWRDDALARELFSERMEAEYLAGHRERALAHFSELLRHLATESERTDAYVTKIGLDTGHGLFGDAIASAREALKRLGVRLPRKATVASVLLGYAAVRRAQAGRSIETLGGLPELDDVDQKCVTKLLVAVAPAAFFVSTELVTVCLMRIAQISMRHGVNDVSAYGLAGYGAVLSGAFGRCHDAHAFGQLALRLNERFGNDALTSKLHFLCGTYLTPWARPFAEAREQLRFARQAAVASGDTAYEAYAAATWVVIHYSEGVELETLERCAEESLAVTTRRRDDDMSAIVSAQLRLAAALRGTATTLSLPGSTDAEFRASLADEHTPIGLYYYYYLNAELAYLFGDAARARALLRDAHRRVQGIFAVPTTVDLLLLDALVAARLHDTGGFAARRRLAWTVARRCRKLAHFARACPANFESHARLAAAEQARLGGDAAAAMEHYAAAIEAARAHGAPKREALALELAARFLGDQARAAEADAYRSEAIAAWRRFGATAKAEALAASQPFGSGRSPRATNT